MTEKKVTKSISWLTLFVCMLVTVAITITITAAQTRNMITNGINHYDRMKDSERIVVLDFEHLNQGFLSNGATQQQALQAINAIVGLFEKDNYLILEKSNTIAYPSKYGFFTDNFAELIEAGYERDIDVNFGVDESMEAARQFIQLMESL